VYQSFFLSFARLENTDHAVGKAVHGHRRLLYLEKLFAAIMLAAPRVKQQAVERLQQMGDLPPSSDVDEQRRRDTYMEILRGIDSLINFYLPACFRVGYLVRCCTWDGRPAGTAEFAMNVLQQCCVLLVHMLDDPNAKNEYVRTIAVAILSWQKWHDAIPGVCFAEESCEALLSRVGNRLESYRSLTGFEAAFDLFLTVPPPSRTPRATRGTLKRGFVDVLFSRLRKLLLSDGCLPYAAPLTGGMKHSEFVPAFPDGFRFPAPLPQREDVSRLQTVLRSALRVLVGGRPVSVDVADFFSNKVRRKSEREQNEYQQALGVVNGWFAKPRQAKRPARPRPPGDTVRHGKRRAREPAAPTDTPT
jgi:hypothetical protein